MKSPSKGGIPEVLADVRTYARLLRSAEHTELASSVKRLAEAMAFLRSPSNQSREYVIAFRRNYTAFSNRDNQQGSSDALRVDAGKFKSKAQANE
jgi:hypothetical protein